MKTASLVLGIIGGVLAIIFAILFIGSGALVGSMAQGIDEGIDELTAQMEEEGWEVVEDGSASVLASNVTEAAAGTLLFIGIASIIGAVMGIVGGALAKKKGTIAGILMVVAAVPSFFTGLGIIASILFIIGGIMAFIPQKTEQKAAV